MIDHRFGARTLGAGSSRLSIIQFLAINCPRRRKGCSRGGGERKASRTVTGIQDGSRLTTVGRLRAQKMRLRRQHRESCSKRLETGTDIVTHPLHLLSARFFVSSFTAVICRSTIDSTKFRTLFVAKFKRKLLSYSSVDTELQNNSRTIVFFATLSSILLVTFTSQGAHHSYT